MEIDENVVCNSNQTDDMTEHHIVECKTTL